MKIATAIAMLKKHGTNYRTWKQKGSAYYETPYYAANVAGHVLAFFECAMPGQASAILHVHDDGKMSFAGKSLTMLIQLSKLNPRKNKPFTVTVEGPERHDGEKPYTYVCLASGKEEAGAFVLALHKAENETDDVNLLEVLPGVPRNAGYHWNDLRKVSEPQPA